MKTSFGAMTGREHLCFVLKYLFMALCVVVALFPIIWVILSSFKTNAEILSNGISLPTHFGFDGYRSALSLVIPMTALLQPVYSVVNNLGLYDTKAGLILVNTALNMPMSLLILRGAFQSIPKAIEEAAYIDGAGFLRTFFQIMMPCAKGGLTSAAGLCFLNTWNEFTFSLILTSSESARTLPLSLSYFTSQFSFNYTALFAAVTIAVIPSIIVFAIFQEQVVSSLTAGSVKE